MNDTQPRTLVLVRHSKASRDALTDRERPLTDHGTRMAVDLGRQLAQRVRRPDLLLVSPATRAQQTAAAMDLSLRAASTRTEEDIYSGGAGGWLAALQRLPDSLGTVVVVGHEPTVSGLAYALHGCPGAEPATGVRGEGHEDAAAGTRTGDAAGDALARQIAFGVSTATAVVLTVPGSWADLAPATARLTEVLVAQR